MQSSYFISSKMRPHFYIFALRQATELSFRGSLIYKNLHLFRYNHVSFSWKIVVTRKPQIVAWISCDSHFLWNYWPHFCLAIELSLNESKESKSAWSALAQLWFYVVNPSHKSWVFVGWALNQVLIKQEWQQKWGQLMTSHTKTVKSWRHQIQKMLSQHECVKSICYNTQYVALRRCILGAGESVHCQVCLLPVHFVHVPIGHLALSFEFILFYIGVYLSSRCACLGTYKYNLSFKY